LKNDKKSAALALFLLLGLRNNNDDILLIELANSLLKKEGVYPLNYA
jgi:hypothetical protein